MDILQVKRLKVGDKVRFGRCIGIVIGGVFDKNGAKSERLSEGYKVVQLLDNKTVTIEWTDFKKNKHTTYTDVFDTSFWSGIEFCLTS